MRVKTDESSKHFNVHKSLLDKYAPNLRIDKTEDGTMTATVYTTTNSLEVFLNWMYTAETPGDMPDVLDEVELFIPAIALGRMEECVEFADRMLDELIERMAIDGGYFPLDKIIEAAKVFEDGSGPFRFLIDFFIHREPINCGGQFQSVSEALSNVENYLFIHELAKKICEKRNFELKHCDDVFDKVVVSGFFAYKAAEVEDNIREGGPWEDDRCQYHYHTELGLPCYNLKRRKQSSRH